MQHLRHYRMWIDFHLFCFNNHHQTTKNLLIRQPWKPNEGTSTLNRLNNFGRCIACQSKTSGVRIYFHSPPQCLLCSRCHADFRIKEQIILQIIFKFEKSIRAWSLTINFRSHSNHTYLSASSNITTLCRPGGSVTFFCANILILFLTTSIPL